jgi:hypothetical protein
VIDRLITDAAGAAGLEPDQARAALAGALGLLEKHADPQRMARLYAQVPGAEALATSDEARARPGGGLFGGLMRGAGGLSGAAMADAMGLMGRLERIGVGKAELKRLLPAARERVRAEVGEDLLGEAVRSVPGVGALLGA